MKNLLLVSFFSVMAFTALAQDWEIKSEAMSPSLKFNSTNVLQKTNYIGSTERDIVLIRYSDDKNEAPYLVRYNYALEEQETENLPFSRGEKYYGGYVNDDEIDLIQTFVENGNLVVKHLIYDVSTLKQQESENIGTYSQNENSQFFVKESFSQNMIATIYIDATLKGANCIVKSYNSMIEEQWSTDYYTDMLDDFVVTDDGEVALFGYSNKNNKGNTHLKFSLLGKNKEEVYETDKAIGNVFRVKLAGYRNNMFYCTGLVKGKDWNIEKKQDPASAFFTLSYSSKEQSVKAYDVHTISKEDYSDIANIPIKNVNPQRLTVQGEQLVSSCVDEDGAILVWQATYDLYYYSSFDRTNYHGLFIIKIDPSGKMSWTKTIRHSGAAIGKNLRQPTKFKLFNTCDSYSIVFIEKEKNISRSANKLYDLVAIGRDKCDLQVLNIDHQGKLSRKFFKLPPKSIIIGAPHLSENGKLLLLMSQPKSSNVLLLNCK